MSNPEGTPGSGDGGINSGGPVRLAGDNQDTGWTQGPPSGASPWQQQPYGEQPQYSGQQPLPGGWVPPQEQIWGQGAAVWPPPATNQAYQPAFYPFKFLLMKVTGNVADFREGSIGIDPEGLTIIGKCQPRAEIYQTIQLVTFLLSVFICIIATLVMRYACMQSSQLRVSWQQVRQVVLQPAKRRACIVYDAPNYANSIKTFSLAFQLPQAEYEAFTDMAKQYSPGVTSEGRIKSAQSIILIFFVFLLLVVLGIAAASILLK